jgi:hypothetical protein
MPSGDYRHEIDATIQVGRAYNSHGAVYRYSGLVDFALAR